MCHKFIGPITINITKMSKRLTHAQNGPNGRIFRENDDTDLQ